MWRGRKQHLYTDADTIANADTYPRDYFHG